MPQRVLCCELMGEGELTAAQDGEWTGCSCRQVKKVKRKIDRDGPKRGREQLDPKSAAAESRGDDKGGLSADLTGRRKLG